MPTQKKMVIRLGLKREIINSIKKPALKWLLDLPWNISGIEQETTSPICPLTKRTNLNSQSITMSKKSAFYSEKELVLLLKSNDRKAFEYLYVHYAKAMYGSIVKIMKDKSKSDDVMQDSFLKIWKNIGLYNPEKGTLFTWLLNVVRHTAIDSLRSDSKFQYHLKWNEVPDSDLSPSMIFSPAYDSIDLKSGIASLAAERKQVIDLVYYNGYTHEEASEHLKLPLGTVKSRVRIALKDLRYLFAVPVNDLKIA